MKKLVALILALCLAMSMLAFASAEAETKTGTAQGFAGTVTVVVTVENGDITALTVDDSGESYPSAGFDRAETVDKLIEAIIAADSADVDTFTGATVTQTAVLEALAAALADEGAAPAAKPLPMATTATSPRSLPSLPIR